MLMQKLFYLIRVKTALKMSLNKF